MHPSRRMGRRIGAALVVVLLTGVWGIGKVVPDSVDSEVVVGEGEEKGERKKEGCVPVWMTTGLAGVGSLGGLFLGWRMGRRAHRVAMRGERKVVYDAIKRLESLAVATHRVEWEWAMEFLKGIGGAKFAFFKNKEIEKHIGEVIRDAGEAMYKWQTGELGDEEGKRVNARFRKHTEETDRLFGKYLGEK